MRTPTYIPAFTSDFLREELSARAGIAVSNVKQVWESSFGVQRYLAEDFSKDNVFLCGDAAHLMSPVGGQNMNIGFADAEMASWLARLIIEKSVAPEQASSLYNHARTLAARTALRRAHHMMVAGTSGGHAWSAARTVALGAVVQTPLRKLLLRQLNMHSIPFRNLDHYRSVYEAKLRL